MNEDAIEEWSKDLERKAYKVYEDWCKARPVIGPIETLEAIHSEAKQ